MAIAIVLLLHYFDLWSQLTDIVTHFLYKRIFLYALCLFFISNCIAH